MKFASRRTVLEPVAGILNRYSMLPGGARVGVAVSGGADSVCLLDVLSELAAGSGWRLTVLHLNHGWRGAESDVDAGFVEDLAGRYSLPCVTGKAAPPAGGNLEQQGREVRRRFFAEQRRALGLDRIATGHTLDDQAETVLFRALRGAGPGGLAGILPVTAEGIVRPLLGVKREWVLAWNRRRGLDWREDPTNADPRFRRNALRALLPELARLVNPAASEALARLAVISQDEEIDWCERVAAAGRAVWREEDGAWVARVDEIAGRGRAMARRLIRQGVENVRGGLISVDYAHIERVLALVERRGGEGKVQLPGGGAERSCGWLRIGSGVAQVVEEREVEGPGGRAVLRGWRPGDEYDGRPFRDRLRRRAVPRWRRGRWPVLASGALLLWAEGFGWSEAGRASGWPGCISLSENPNVSI